jgi:predicted ribosomally synthesized peptide with nif11-like leader
MNTLTPVETTKNLEQFYQEVLNNSVLQEQLKAATDPEQLCQLAVQLGAEQGYHFTLAEVQAALAIEVALTEHILPTRAPGRFSPQLIDNQCSGCEDCGGCSGCCDTPGSSLCGSSISVSYWTQCSTVLDRKNKAIAIPFSTHPFSIHKEKIMTTTTLPTPNLAQFNSELLDNPILHQQLKAATSLDHLSQLTIQILAERGYRLTIEELQAFLPDELAIAEHNLENQTGSSNRHSHLCIG